MRSESRWHPPPTQAGHRALRTTDALRATGADVVRKALNHRGAFATLWAKLNNDEQQTEMPPRYPVAVPVVHLTAAEPIVPYAAEAPAEPPTPLLVVNLRERRVTYRGHEIPTRPPHNLQRQPLLALAVLARRTGETITMSDLAEGMFKLGALQKRPITPDGRDLCYKPLRPFRKALAKSADTSEIDRLIESVPGVGLRPNCAAQVTATMQSS